LASVFERKRDTVRVLTRILSSHYLSEKEKPNPLDYIELIRDPHAIADKFNTLQRKAESSVLSFSKGPAVTDVSDNIEGLNVLQRGVIVRTIYEIKYAINEENMKGIEAFIKAGEETRFHPDLPIKMFVFDTKIVLPALIDRIESNHSFTTLVIEHADIAKAFTSLFEKTWESSMTFDEYKTQRKEV